MVQLETPHLRLCTWDDSDLERFRPIATDAQVMRFITGGTPWPDERIQLFLRRNQETFRDHGFCRWKLEEKPSGDLIGFCGLGFLPGIADPEIGWWLTPARWGLGLATEAAQAAFEHATKCRRVRRIVSIAHPDNTASIRIMQKLGFTFEKALDYNERPVLMFAFHVPVKVTP